MSEKQINVLEFLKAGNTFKYFHQFYPLEIHIQAFDSDDNEHEFEYDGRTIRSLIKRNLCQWVSVYRTIQPDTETFELRLTSPSV